MVSSKPRKSIPCRSRTHSFALPSLPPPPFPCLISSRKSLLTFKPILFSFSFIFLSPPLAIFPLAYFPRNLLPTGLVWSTLVWPIITAFSPLCRGRHRRADFKISPTHLLAQPSTSRSSTTMKLNEGCSNYRPTREKRNFSKLRRRRRKPGTEWRFSQLLREATGAMDRAEQGVSSYS
jgi:hypothetical protein